MDELYADFRKAVKQGGLTGKEAGKELEEGLKEGAHRAVDQISKEIKGATPESVRAAKQLADKIAGEINHEFQKKLKLDHEAEKAARQLGERIGASIRSGIDKGGTALTVGVTLPIIAAANAAKNAARDLIEAQNKAKVVFGESIKLVSDFGDASAKAYGISNRAANEYSATFGNILQGTKLATPALAQMSVELTKLGADMASFNNLSIDESLEKIRAGLVGETEPLRTVGVLLSEAAVQAKAVQLGFKGKTKELSDSQKMLARYAIILEQTKKQQGDFARTSSEAANQERALKAETEDLAAKFGKDLLPLYKDGLSVARDLVGKFNSLDSEARKQIITWTAYAAAAGPVVKAVSLLGGMVRFTREMIGLSDAYVAAQAKMAEADAMRSGVGGAAGGFFSRFIPVGTAGTAVAAGGSVLALKAVLDWGFKPMTDAIADSDKRMSGLWGAEVQKIRKALDDGKTKLQILEQHKKDLVILDGKVTELALKNWQVMYEQALKLPSTKGKPGASSGSSNLDIEKMLKDAMTGGGTSTGSLKGARIPKESVTELTTAILEQMARSVKLPGGDADAACGYFASAMIAKFTKGVTDEGKKLEWSAGGLVERLRKMGGTDVGAGDAVPGALAYRKGSGPSGMHVGVYLGGGQVADANGQRDGKRNTLGFSGVDQWAGFINMPGNAMDKKFSVGQDFVDERVVRAWESRGAILDELKMRVEDFRRSITLWGNDSKTAALEFDILNQRVDGTNLKVGDLMKTDSEIRQWFETVISLAREWADLQERGERIGDIFGKHEEWKQRQTEQAKDGEEWAAAFLKSLQKEEEILSHFERAKREMKGYKLRPSLHRRVLGAATDADDQERGATMATEMSDAIQWITDAAAAAKAWGDRRDAAIGNFHGALDGDLMGRWGSPDAQRELWKTDQLARYQEELRGLNLTTEDFARLMGDADTALDRFLSKDAEMAKLREQVDVLGYSLDRNLGDFMDATLRDGRHFATNFRNLFTGMVDDIGREFLRLQMMALRNWVLRQVFGSAAMGLGFGGGGGSLSLGDGSVFTGYGVGTTGGGPDLGGAAPSAPVHLTQVFNGPAEPQQVRQAAFSGATQALYGLARTARRR